MQANTVSSYSCRQDYQTAVNALLGLVKRPLRSRVSYCATIVRCVRVTYDAVVAFRVYMRTSPL